MSFPTSRLFVVAAFTCLSAVVFSQSDQFVRPYAVTAADGTLQGIVWNAQGAQRVVKEAEKQNAQLRTRFEVSLFGNDPFYNAVIRNRFPSNYLSTFTMTALRSPQGSDNSLPQANSTAKGARTGFKASHITFGGGTTKIDREWRGITVIGDTVDVQPDTISVSKEMLLAAKRQKMWTCSNFRITVGGTVIDDAISFDPIELDYASFGDLDGDGVADMALQGDSFVLDIPKFSKYGSTIFETALASTIAGTPKLLPVKVEYLDEDGLTILSLSFVIAVNGINPSDMFFDPSAPSNNVRVHTKIKRDLAVEMERRSGGF